MPQFSEIEIQAINKLRDNLIINDKYRNEIVKRCPVCGGSVQDRLVSLYKELINKLYDVYRWCGEHKCHEFEMGDIKHLLDKNAYARFGDLVRFGGLVYKTKTEEGGRQKAHYGLNMARCKEFFRGDREIPIQITLNQITDEIIDAKYVTIKDFPELYKLLDENGVYNYEMIL